MEQESVNGQVALPQAPSAEKKPDNKEENHRRLAMAKEKAEMELERERSEKAQLIQELQQIKSRPSAVEADDEDDFGDDGYVETKRLKKTLSRLEQRIDQKIEKKAEERARHLIDEERQKNSMFRLKAEYKDFDQVLTNETANAFSEKYPGMADVILKVPDEYERRKLAYEAIKSLGLHEKKPDPSVQERIEKNQRNLYFTPTGMGVGASQSGDFTEAGKKAAFEKMRSLAKSPLRA